MVLNFFRMVFFWVYLFFVLCCVRFVIFFKMMIYKIGCLYVLDFIYQEVKYVMVKNSLMGFFFFWGIFVVVWFVVYIVSVMEINGRGIGFRMCSVGDFFLYLLEVLDSCYFFLCRIQMCEGFGVIRMVFVKMYVSFMFSYLFF